MADQTTIRWNYTVLKDSQSTSDTHSFSYTPASHFKGFSLIASAPTSVTTISFSPAATVASFSIKNLDSANFLSLYTVVGGTNGFAKISAGESLPPIKVMPGTTYFIKADTATVYYSLDFDGAS